MVFRFSTTTGRFVASILQLDATNLCPLCALALALVVAPVWSATEKPADSNAAKFIVENFDSPKRATPGSHAPYGAFSDDASLGQCYVFFEDDRAQVFGGHGHSLQLQWDTSKPGAYAGYWQELRNLNLSDYNFLSFQIKGAKGGEILKVGLRGKRDSPYESKIFVHDALKSGVTTDWQKILIPLGWFQAVESWSDVSVFSLNFENAFGSGKGQILVDDIAFER